MIDGPNLVLSESTNRNTLEGIKAPTPQKPESEAKESEAKESEAKESEEREQIMSDLDTPRIENVTTSTKRKVKGKKKIPRRGIRRRM